ncbi:mitochondrial PGP phosphatase [Usnea florida]
MNISATLNVFNLLRNPRLCLPHATVPTFERVPTSISTALTVANGGRRPDIRAVVLDKDNCFAKPKENSIYGPYKKHFDSIRKVFPGPRVLIVSNSAGTRDDPHGKEAKLLEHATGVKVFNHSTKKPGCGLDVFNYFQSIANIRVEHPSHIAVIGDRLFTDVIMANKMGAWSIWIKDGIVEESGLSLRIEKGLPEFLIRRGFKAPVPKVY